MRYTLANDVIKAEIDSFGAELKSVMSLKDNHEYMWNGDKKYWGRTSPVLFPFVGSLKNRSFTLNGKSYQIGQHGFARDMEHTLISQSDDSIWFELKANEASKKMYPFDFELKIGYQLIGNEIKVLWEVKNTDANLLPFSIGAHPAFMFPACGEPDKEGYQISFGAFNKEKTQEYKNVTIDSSMELLPLKEIVHHGNSMESGLSITEEIHLPLTDGKCNITPGFFDRCTYMIEDNQANSVGLIDKNGHEYVTVLFDTPLFALWSPEGKNAPFVCIEPWYGRCDHQDFEGDVYQREYTNLLKEQELFHAEYVIRFN